MTNLNTFIKEDEEIQLKIKKSFRSWLVVIAGQTSGFFMLLYLMTYIMKNPTEVILALLSVVYVGICSWILALKMYDKRFITNKKIILISHKKHEPVKLIYLSQIKVMHLSYNLLGGHIITIIMNNNIIHHIEDVSHNKDYISYINQLITTNTLTNQPQPTPTTKSKNTKDFFHEKLPTNEDIHLTNLKPPPTKNVA